MTEIKRENGIRRLKLEGRIAGPWVEELRRLAEDWLVETGRFQIHLAEVSFVDAIGVELLRELHGHGVELCHPSRFVADLVEAK